MLHRESNWDQVVKALLLSEVFIEFDASELLDEENKNFSKSFRILIQNCHVVSTIQAANEALDEEVHWEGEVRAVRALQSERN